MNNVIKNIEGIFKKLLLILFPSCHFTFHPSHHIEQAR